LSVAVADGRDTRRENDGHPLSCCSFEELLGPDIDVLLGEGAREAQGLLEVYPEQG
jgi:hypothetical protein